MNTAISIKVVHEQSGKVEYERERLLGIANKLMNFQSGSQQPFALVFDFSALLVDNLNCNSCIQNTIRKTDLNIQMYKEKHEYETKQTIK